MDIVLIGTNYKRSPLAIREKFSFSKKTLEVTYKRFLEEKVLLSCVVLSTCNRVEIYAEVVEPLLGKSYLKEFLSEYLGHNEIDLSNYLYCLENESAIGHLFRVACGLDSQILGEKQILVQVRDAYLYSKDFWKASDYLDKIFNKALEVGKRVRQVTRISEGNVSVATVAIRLLEEKLGALGNISILIIGVGKISQLVLRYLKERDIKAVIIANRTYDKAKAIADDLNYKVVGFDRLYEELRNVDAVISSTSSPHLILKEARIREVVGIRKNPLFILDLAVPRDVEESARFIPNVMLYNIDNLSCIIEENLKKRREEVALAESVINEEIKGFLKTLWEKNALSLVQGKAS